MAQRNPDKPSLDQVLRLVEQLSDTEQEELRRKLTLKSWGERWDALVARVAERNKGQAPLTEEEIYEEFTAYRREQRAERLKRIF